MCSVYLQGIYKSAEFRHIVSETAVHASVQSRHIGELSGMCVKGAAVCGHRRPPAAQEHPSGLLAAPNSQVTGGAGGGSGAAGGDSGYISYTDI